MNYTLIILGVILLVIIYVMFVSLSGKPGGAPKIVTLNASSTNPNVPFSAMSNPASSRYYLSFWVTVENLASATDIFSIKKSDTDILKVGFKSDATLTYTVSNKEHTIMQNFPIQKWVHVILSIDGNVIDMYIDGKLIRSEKLTTPPTAPNKDNTNIIFAQPTSTSVIHIANFERNPTSMDPSLAWSIYLAGNGGNSFSNSYNASFTLTKNKLDINKYSLF